MCRLVVSLWSLVMCAVLAVACDGADDARETTATSPATQTAAPTAEATYYEIPPPEAPRTRPARSDDFGTWLTVEINDVSVEIPTSDNWRAQFVRHPCFGDGRFYMLLEERSTGDRLRVDPLDAVGVVSTSTLPATFAPLRERILRSITGAYQEPIGVQTFGPQPTSEACADEDPNAVPTLISDALTPPAG